MSVEELQDRISPKLTEAVILEFAGKASGLRNVKIKEIRIKPPKKDESYGGIITRFALDLSGENEEGEAQTFFLPVITKSLPPGLGRRKTLRSVEFFRNEAAFYEKVWPALDKFQQSVSKKFDNVSGVLSCFTDGHDDYIAMVDLSYQNYKVTTDVKGLDHEHAVLGVRMFAEFHALALVMKDQQAEVFEAAAASLEETLFEERLRSWYGPFQRRLYEVAMDAVEKELPPVYLEKMRALCDDDLFGAMCRLCKVRGPLAVITHGDTWLPNLLIKPKEGDDDEPEKIVMIDFAIARYTTLSNDLILFFFVCTDLTVLEEHWDELITEYHEALQTALEKFGSRRDLISLKDIQEDLKLKTLFGIGFGLDPLILSLVDEEDVSDLHLDGDEAVPMEELLVVKPFKRQEQRRRYADLIKFIVDKELYK